MNPVNVEEEQHKAWTIGLEKVGRDDVAIVGGKCASLGELLAIGVPVPPGFVVTSHAFRYFLHVSGIDRSIEDRLRALQASALASDDLEAASQAIRRLVETQPLPEDLATALGDAYRELEARLGAGVPVAVRSSATAEDLPGASFAGQMDTFLFVRGLAAVATAVKRCFASAFTARALAYRIEKGFDRQPVAISVGVQAMVAPRASGVMFTINPTTGDRNQIWIEAAWGAGEAVAQGHVTPDQYVLEKHGAGVRIVDRRIAVKERMTVEGNGGPVEVPVPAAQRDRPCLDDELLASLGALAIRIERHYGTPMDIEWAQDELSGRLYVLQARPETVWSRTADPGPAPRRRGRLLLRGKGASPGVVSGRVRVIRDLKDIHTFQPGEILVTEMTTTEWLPAERVAAALITNTGGVTCHAAIISRELGIPCIVATQNGTEVLKTGDVVTVDGLKGTVHAGELNAPAGEAPAVVPPVRDPTPVTATRVYLILGSTDNWERVRHLPFDGVGLMRIEFIIAQQIGEHPMHMLAEGRGEEFVERLAEGILAMAEMVYPRPVLLRFSDLKSNEYRILRGGDRYEPTENNPMIGWRGASRYIHKDYEPAFRLECRAVRRVREEMKNVWSMLPFVRQTWEVERIYRIMEEEGLRRGGDYQVWIMAEVPSNFLLADRFAQLCDGFTVGVNDLVQLMLGVDRDSAILANMGLFDEMDEAVLQAIRHLIAVAHRHGREVCVCGQAPSMYPKFTEWLVESEVDMIGVNPDAVTATRVSIAHAEQRMLLRRLATLEGKQYAAPGWARSG